MDRSLLGPLTVLGSEGSQAWEGRGPGKDSNFGITEPLVCVLILSLIVSCVTLGRRLDFACLTFGLLLCKDSAHLACAHEGSVG